MISRSPLVSLVLLFVGLVNTFSRTPGFFLPRHRILLDDVVGTVQWDQLEKSAGALMDLNKKINVVSRKDLDAESLVERHFLPSLALLRVPGLMSRLREKTGSHVMDVGTGGGFPGLPLAICCPESTFTLVDSVGKKITVVKALAAAAGISNVQCIHGRVEELTSKHDFILGRSVTALPRFVGWVRNSFRPDSVENWLEGQLGNGILYIKGGDISQEVGALGLDPAFEWELADLAPGLTSDKRVLYFPARDVLKC